MSACACKRIDDEKLVEIVKYLVENGADYRATDKLVIEFSSFFIYFIILKKNFDFQVLFHSTYVCKQRG